MQQSFLRKLNIRDKEGGLSILLFISAFFLGGFICSYDIVSHAIFFEYWSQEDFSMVYIFSGGFGIVLFSIYTFLHKRVSYKFFHFINTTLVMGLVVAFFVLYIIRPDEIISFAGLALMFPVNLLAMLTFWRFKRKLLLPEQTKRIFPFVEFGFVTGVVIVCTGIFFFLRNYTYQIMIPAATFFVAFLFLLQFPVDVVHRNVRIFNHKKEQRVPVKASPFILWSTKFTRNLLLFTVTSALIGFFLHYGFINLFRIRYNEVAQFSMYYPLFIAIMFALIHFMEKVLVHRILYSYDSPYSLVLLPVGVILTLALAAIGTLVLRKIEHANPLPFLLLIGITKIVYEIVKYAIQLPSVRTLYRSLDIRFLQIIFPRIEGSAVMFGLILAGGVIAGLHSYINRIMYLIAAGAGLSLIWLYFAIRLVKHYKNALQDTYRKLRINRAYKPHAENYNEKIREILVGDNPVKVINAMRLSARIEPLSYEKGLQRMLANPEAVIQNYVLKCIEEESLLELLPELKKIEPASDESKAVLSRLIEEFEKKENLIKEGVDLESMVSSRDVNKRVLAAEIIGSRKDVTYTSALVNLTREFEPDVKIAAVKAMARISSSDHSYLLIEFLNSPEYHAYAFEALVQIGDPALDYLERLFINPNTDDKILSRVIRIYGKIATEKAIDLLLGKLENQSKRVTMSAIEALHEANFQANSFNLHRILNIVVRTIHVLGYNYLVVTSLPTKKVYRELRNAYLKEIDVNYDLLFELLSLAYNARTMFEIKELLDKGSVEDISHAVEMIDHFVYDDIKPVLFPVVENIPMRERVKRLQYYFPIESMDEEEILTSTLTRDYNLLSIYPRICALQLSLTKPDFEVNQELISNLFHPNRLLREVAALVVHKKDPDLFENVMERLDPDIQFELRETLTIVENENSYLTVEKFNLLRKTDRLAGMPESILIEFAEAFQEFKFSEGSVLNLNTNTKEFSLFVLIEGEMQMENQAGEIINSEVNHLYYTNIFVNAGIKSVRFTRNSVLLAIDDDTIEELLFDHTEIANCVLSCIEQFKEAG